MVFRYFIVAVTVSAIVFPEPTTAITSPYDSHPITGRADRYGGGLLREATVRNLQVNPVRWHSDKFRQIAVPQDDAVGSGLESREKFDDVFPDDEMGDGLYLGIQKTGSKVLDEKLFEASPELLNDSGKFHDIPTNEHVDDVELKFPNRNERRSKLAKRSYYQNSFPAYNTMINWRPPLYQLNRPYYIPIFGIPGRVPIYYPPQPFLLNPGVPADNPLRKRPFNGPTYLPPLPETTTVRLKDRFNDNNEDYDDSPVWGVSTPSNIRPPNQVPQGVIPTRTPQAIQATPQPSLIHAVGKNDNTNSDRDNTVPLKVGSNDVDSDIPPIFSDNRPATTTFRPASITPSGPSSCVWAIISCCSALSNDAPQNCFEQRGCSGPFWGSSPCESEFAKAAIATALNYYNSKR